MSNRSVFPLVFTDLDGTLLDHESYSARPADRLIQQITCHSFGSIIPVTSKTRAELRLLEQILPIRETISVTENGSVIHVAQGQIFEGALGPQTILSGRGYEEIRNRIDALPKRLRQHITGFADMTPAAISQETGLGGQEARLAKEREASEPFLWSGTDAALKELGMILAGDDIRIQRGGRFYHFTGNATKERAMARIKASFVEQKPDRRIISVALGDGPNDLEMIEAADFGVIMPNAGGVAICSSKSDVRMAPAPGPQGWVVAVRELFTELGIILSES